MNRCVVHVGIIAPYNCKQVFILHVYRTPFQQLSHLLASANRLAVRWTSFKTVLKHLKRCGGDTHGSGYLGRSQERGKGHERCSPRQQQ